MSNHVHYLSEPAQPQDLPKIMHFLNRYSKKRNNLSHAPSLPHSPTSSRVTESPQLTRVVRQFIEANRAPWQAEKDF